MWKIRFIRFLERSEKEITNKSKKIMYIRLIRNKPQGNAITGRLVIDGRWFCNTLERVGYQIPALCYHVAVTQSPKFKRLLPIVQNVPQRSGIRFHRGTKPEHSTGCILLVADNNPSPLHSTPYTRQNRCRCGKAIN